MVRIVQLFNVTGQAVLLLVMLEVMFLVNRQGFMLTDLPLLFKIFPSVHARVRLTLNLIV